MRLHKTKSINTRHCRGRKYFRTACLICFVITFTEIKAQEKEQQSLLSIEYSWEDFVDEFTNSYYSDGNYSEINEELLENLQNIHNNPININTASREDLLQIPFLSQSQADSIVSYVSKHGPMLSLGELMFIKRIDFQTRKFLTIFLKCAADETKKPTVLDMLTTGKHEIAINTSTPFYTADGYKTDSKISNSSKYLGDKNRFALRYHYKYNDELQFGITTEKDAGEPFACRGNFLTDSYSAYFYRKQKNGRYAYALGDYRIRFAEGLVVGNNYFYGGKSALLDAYNSRRVISAHTSTSENDFFRGGAGFMRFGNITATAFVSYNRMDAILNEDGEITSFPNNGYHRTSTEQKRRNNTENFTAGTDVSIQLKKWNIGIAAAISHYNRKISPREAEYNKFAMRGKNFRAASAHYNYNGKRLSLRGEAAISEKSATAIINTIKWEMFPYITLTSIQRIYSKKYAEPFADSFSSSSKTSNERGVLTGISAEVSNNLILRGYVDLYRFPWATYSYRAPMNGVDYMAEAYLHNYEGDYLSAEWRGSYRKCDKGYGAADTVPYTKNLIKISGKITLNKISLYSNLSGTSVTKRKETSRGWMFNQRVSYKCRSLRIHGGISYFDTDNYSSRLYAYESNVMYVYNLFTAMYGNGIRFSLLGDLKIGRNIEIACKYAGIKYFDRNTSGSGAQKVNSSYLSNIICMARIIF